jgi:hypothetical protein
MFRTKIVEKNESHILCPVNFCVGLAVLEIITKVCEGTRTVAALRAVSSLATQTKANVGSVECSLQVTFLPESCRGAGPPVPESN